jgi:hypothetical protein
VVPGLYALDEDEGVCLKKAHLKIQNLELLNGP